MKDSRVNCGGFRQTIGNGLIWFGSRVSNSDRLKRNSLKKLKLKPKRTEPQNCLNQNL